MLWSTFHPLNFGWCLLSDTNELPCLPSCCQNTSIIAPESRANIWRIKISCNLQKAFCHFASVGMEMCSLLVPSPTLLWIKDFPPSADIAMWQDSRVLALVPSIFTRNIPHLFLVFLQVCASQICASLHLTIESFVLCFELKVSDKLEHSKKNQ